MVGISENKDIDYRVTETCAIMWIQVTYETDHISVLCHSTMSSPLNICFLCILLGSKRKISYLKKCKF